MTITQWLKVSLISISAIALAACHHYKPLPGTGGAMSADQEAQSKTYGMSSGSGYQGQVQKDASGRIINPLVAPANQTYYFDFDSSTIYQTDMKAISIQANYLTTHASAKVRLEGNTDNRGSREYNIGLGWRRDQAVAQILEQDGVSPKQIDMMSYGKERPVALGDNEAAWRLNRRVNLIYEAY